MFEDILIFDEKPTDTVRLSATTIEELFKSTDYSLEDVRKNKLVKPISLTLLPIKPVPDGPVVAQPCNNKPRTTIPKIFFMNLDPTRNLHGIHSQLL